MRRLVVLGSTGSIGGAALDVVADLRTRGEALEVAGLSAHRNVDRLAGQIRALRPAAVAVDRPEDAQALRRTVPEWSGPIRTGPEGVAELAGGLGADLVVVAVEGVAGLRPTLAALAAGADVALATKEVLVAGGTVVLEAAAQAGRRVLPIDSELSALWQCLEDRAPEEISRLWLTASGGPFRRTPVAALRAVTPEAALRHPTWAMGPKVTIDSATLMNKGLEIIEAHRLFGLPADRIEVVVHPQSLVHACVELIDGSVLAHLAPRDMRHPIQYVFTRPRRMPFPAARLDLTTLGGLEFEPPDLRRFPCLGLAREALARGGTAPAALNAANEVAVRLFLSGRIGFGDIPRIVRRVLEDHAVRPAASLDAVMDADRDARRAAETAAVASSTSPPPAQGVL